MTLGQLKNLTLTKLKQWSFLLTSQKNFFQEGLADEDGNTTIQGFTNFGAAPLDQASSTAAEEEEALS